MERSIALIALFAALIGALALMPAFTLISGVPITLQALGVMLAGTVLGARRGALAVLLYLGLILIGLPIASGGGAGPAAFARPSVGYLIAFPVGAFVIGLVADRFSRPMDFWPAFIGALVGGIGVVTIGGIIGMKFWLNVGWVEAVGFALPFLIGDALKAALAAGITQGLARARPQLAALRG